MKKVFIRTFGCQMNEYDSEKMLSVLAEEHGGIEQVTQPDDADIILFNTCSVREKAQEKVFSDLGRVRPLKEKNPDLIIGVAGCVARKRCTACPNSSSTKKPPVSRKSIFPSPKSRNSTTCRLHA